MSTTFIDTNSLPTHKTAVGEDKEILNEALAGAKNVKGVLHWIEGGKTFEAAASDKHQLIYFMDGQGSVKLEGKDYDLGKGGGIYLQPSETASVTAGQGETVKLFHLIVPQIPA